MLPFETTQAPRVAGGMIELTDLEAGTATKVVDLPPGAVIESASALVLVASDDTGAGTVDIDIDGVSHGMVSAGDVTATGALTVVEYVDGPIQEADSISITLTGNGDGTVGALYFSVAYTIEGRADEVYG